MKEFEVKRPRTLEQKLLMGFDKMRKKLLDPDERLKKKLLLDREENVLIKEQDLGV